MLFLEGLLVLLSEFKNRPHIHFIEGGKHRSFILSETKRSATFLRNIESFLRSEPRLPGPGVPMEGSRPWRQLCNPAILAGTFYTFGSIPFSSKIF